MLDRKLVRDLVGSRGLLLAITSIMAVGVTCFVSFRSAYHNLDDAQARYYRQCRMADFWIDVKKVPLAELPAVGRVPGVEELRSRIVFSATVDLEAVPQPLNCQVISLPDRPGPVINDIVLRQGGYFSEQRPDQVIVNDAFARAHRIYPGQSLHLILNNRRQPLQVVGTAISSEFTYLLGPGALVPDPEHFGVFYIKQSYAEDVFDFAGAANQVVGRFSPVDAASREAALQRAESLLEPFGALQATPLSQQVSNQFLSNEIAGLGVTATIIPAVFLLVAAAVLNVLVNRLARQQRTVIGTLKALGYGDAQVALHFLKFGTSVGVLGGLLGSGLGYLAATGMTALYRQYFEFPDLRSEFHWYTHAVGMSVSLACSVLGSLHGAREVLRLSPAEAMRPERPRQGGAIWLERLRFVWSRLSSGWRIALRTVFRSRLRTGAGLFAAAMGSGMLSAGFIMLEIQDFLLDFQFQRIVRSDLDLAFVDERGREAWDEVRSLPAVDYSEPLLQVGCTLVHGPYHRKAGVTGLVRGSRLTVPRDQRGTRIEMPGSGLVLSRRLAEILHVQPGDRLTMIPTQGERRPVETRVARISDTYIGLAAYAEIEELSRLVGEEFAMTGAQLLIDPLPSARLALFRRLKETPGVQAVVSREDLIQSMTETLLQNQLVFIGMLVLFAGVIFFGSIVNSSLVSLAERRREVATLRALGYTPWQLGALFLRESLLVHATGTLLGLPCGYGLVWAAAEAYRTNDLIRMPVITAPWVWWGTLLMALAFILLSHLVVQLRIHRLNVLEALNVKE
ncbi:MAG: ABC transporter permease [Pirellulaceae bacterium]|nr:ABC transporter permease [Pirellulaceae bacterium]